MDPNSQNQQNSLLSLDEYLANEELYAGEIPVQSKGKTQKILDFIHLFLTFTPITITAMFTSFFNNYK